MGLLLGPVGPPEREQRARDQLCGEGFPARKALDGATGRGHGPVHDAQHLLGGRGRVGAIAGGAVPVPAVLAAAIRRT